MFKKMAVSLSAAFLVASVSGTAHASLIADQVNVSISSQGRTFRSVPSLTGLIVTDPNPEVVWTIFDRAFVPLTVTIDIFSDFVTITMETEDTVWGQLGGQPGFKVDITSLDWVGSPSIEIVAVSSAVVGPSVGNVTEQSSFGPHSLTADIRASTPVSGAAVFRYNFKTNYDDIAGSNQLSEPVTIALFGLGLLGLAAAARRASSALRAA